jgi:multiple sugar transport system ATP-binding protein
VGLSLDVAPGELVALVGPPGCGGDTALRLVAGLETLSGGRILISGADVSGRPPSDRSVAMVHGDQMLYPHMTVAENIAFSLKLRGRSRAERRALVRRTAALLELEAKLDARPHALSAQERQRAALGRAIARGADALLLRDPLAGLAPQLRAEAIMRIAALQAQLGPATIHVSGDLEESLALGHRVAVMRDGVLQQLDTARNLYEKPVNAFVAGFIGSPAMNFRTVKITPSGAMLDGSVALPMTAPTLGAARRENMPSLIVGYRPEAARVTSTSDPGTLVLVATLVEQLGAQARVHGRLEGDGPHELPWVLICESRQATRVGERVRFTLDARAAHLFDPDTGLRLN